MNRKLLNEEMDRIRLLYGYKTEKTLDENISKILGQKIILERAASELFMGAKEMANVERASLMPSLESALKETGSITILDGKGIARSTKNVEEIALAMKEGRIAFAELGKVAKSMFKNATSLEVKSIAADMITGTASFEKKFGKMNKENIVQELMNGPGKYTKSEAETLATNFKNKSGKLKPIEVKPIKPEPVKVNPVKVEPVKVEPVKVSEPRIVNNNNIRIELEGGGSKVFRDSEEFIRYQKQEGEAFASQYSKEYNQLAKDKGYTSFEEFMRMDSEGAKNALKELEGKGPIGRSLDWLKKTVKYKTLFGLAKIAGVSWLVWYLFFKDNGKTLECPEGQKDDGKGNCITAGGGGSGESGGSGGSGDSNNSSGTGSGQTNVVMDVEGNKYTECTPPYYKGCVAKKGNDDIRKAQECLGVTPNGFFNQETESALQSKINKKTFSPSDISSICAKSYGASNFSY